VIYTLYSEDGAEFKMLKELFCQTEYLRKIVSSAKENCCGIIEILCHRSGKQLSYMVNFLTVQKLQKRAMVQGRRNRGSAGGAIAHQILEGIEPNLLQINGLGICDQTNLIFSCI
jgi:hypothetical protein